MGYPFDEALDSVADARPADWARLEQDAQPAVRDAIRTLKAIASLHEACTHPGPPRISLPFDWGPLHVREWIAHGAHGEVYRAWDPRLERDVALKLLNTDGNYESTAIREGRLLARVRHPSVVTVYGADRIDGQAGIWMEFVRGRTLRAHVDVHGPMSCADAAKVGADVCRGLAAVHRAGLIHRDVNAQNVIRDESGRTILMDLGSGADSDQDVAIEGSPVYLAPEVLGGAPASVASDVYAAGVLLFFLVTGRYPVTAGSVDELRDRVASGAVEALRPAAGRDAAFCRAVNRALAHDSAARFATAEEMAAALSQAIAGDRPGISRAGWLSLAATTGLALAMVLLAASHRNSPWNSAPGSGRPRSVLVATFANRTGNATYDNSVEAALGYALEDSSRLAVVTRDRVSGTLALMRRADTNVLGPGLAREVAMRDGAIDFVVSGEITSAGPATLIRAELSDPASNRAIASVEELAVDPSTVPLAIRRLAVRLRAAAGDDAREIQQSVQRLERVTTPSLAALKMYSDARIAFDRDEVAEAEAILRATVEADPSFASAYIWLAWCESNLGQPPTTYVRDAKRAVDLAPSTTEHERYFIVASYDQMIGRYESATAQLEALVRRYPDDAWGLRNLAHLYEIEGRPSAAALLLQDMARLRPSDFYAAALAAQYAGEYLDMATAKSAVARARHLLDLGAPARKTFDAPRTWVRLYPFHDTWVRGDVRAARKVLDLVGDLEDVESEGASGLTYVGSADLSLGRLQMARGMFDRLQEPNQRRLWMAVVELATGNPDRAHTLASEFRRPDLVGVSMLVRLGAIDEAKRLLAFFEPRIPPGHVPWARQEIALAEHDPASLAAAERQGPAWLKVMAGIRAFTYTESFAEALRRAGELDNAARLLEEGSRNLKPRLFTKTSHNGYFWMRLRKLLADVYRDQGRVADARAVERELLDDLAVADADNPLLIEMRRRAGLAR